MSVVHDANVEAESLHGRSVRSVVAGCAVRRSVIAASMVVCAARTGFAQQTPPGAKNCDSIIAAARVDSEEVKIFVTVGRADGYSISEEQARGIATAVATAFIAPRPFRLPVFSGPAQMRVLRRLSDTLPELRAPTVTGVYRFTAMAAGSVHRVETVRAALIPGFDSAATDAIRAAAVLKNLIAVPDKQDSMRIEVRFSTDSMINSRRLAAAWFPRMPVLDAVPYRDNPKAQFPDVEKLDSASRGEVVLRFVVDREGLPAMETIEVVRATALTFLRSALVALPLQRFTPARIDGCAVAQEVSYPFAFLMPQPPPRH